MPKRMKTRKSRKISKSKKRRNTMKRRRNIYGGVLTPEERYQRHYKMCRPIWDRCQREAQKTGTDYRDCVDNANPDCNHEDE